MISFLIHFLFFLLFLICVFAGAISLYWLLGGLTVVKEGTVKIVVRFGEYHKPLMVKKGYRITESSQIIPLDFEEEEKGGFLGGLKIVGIPFVDTIFKKDLKWVKSLPEGKLEDRFEENVDFLLADVHYQYGLRFNNAEDKDLLSLSGQMTLTASIDNPYKAQFRVKNWFDALVNRILPSIREYISNHAYEEIINDPETKLDQDVMKKLRGSGILDELEELYGIRVHALETVNIDPDENYRKATLAKWQAARDAEKRLGSTTGALMQMIADQTGADLNHIRAEFKSDPDVALKKYEGLVRINKDFIEQQIASDAGSLRRYYFQGGSGGMDLVALLGDVFRGSFGGRESGGKSNESKTTKSFSGKKGRENTKDVTQQDMLDDLDELEKE